VVDRRGSPCGAGQRSGCSSGGYRVGYADPTTSDGWPGTRTPCPRTASPDACGVGPRHRGGPRPRRRATGPVAGCPRPGPGSDGWPGCGRVRPRSCGSSWSIRLSTCRALLVALRHQSRAPFTGASGVLMRPCDRGVGVSVPVQITGAVGLGVQRGLDPCPGAIFFPPGEPFVQRLPWPVPFGHISPRHPGTHPKQDPVEHLPVITPPSTTLRGHVWQQRRNPRVLGVGQLEPSTHDRRDSRPSTKDPGDTP
jgi:hypothetical protein